MAEKKNVEVQDIPKADEINLVVCKALEVEDDAIIIMVADWMRRVYFDLPTKDLEKIKENKSHYKGRNFNVNYVGDFNDPFTVVLLPIKSIE